MVYTACLNIFQTQLHACSLFRFLIYHKLFQSPTEHSKLIFR